MDIRPEPAVAPTELLALYTAVGWTGYTRDPESLYRSVRNAHLVLVARDPRGVLAGLARTISDGETVCYVQDLLVHPDFRRQGIGGALLTELMQRYARCRLFLLTTDHESTADGRRSHAFYRRMGLVEHHEQGMSAFSRPVTNP